MSFILDALKKSEAERQNQAAAGLSTTPRASQSDQLPTWAIAIMGALSLAVVVLALAWWQSRPAGTSPTPARAADNTATAARPVAAAAGGPVRNLATEARLAGRPDSSIAMPAAEPAANSTPPTTPAASPVRPVSPAPSTAKPAAVPTAGALPTNADLAAQGIALPELNLDIHVFSSNRTERFVFISCSKYREGDRLRDGPRVDEITVDGVVLQHQGISFLLPRD
jgi:general secretion pathway protein B